MAYTAKRGQYGLANSVSQDRIRKRVPLDEFSSEFIREDNLGGGGGGGGGNNIHYDTSKFFTITLLNVCYLSTYS